MSFDEKGLVVQRYPEILGDIEDYQVANIEQKFKYQNNKGIYQLNSIYALSVDQISQLVEAAFDSIKLSGAEGQNLEEIAFTRGVYRIQASPSFTSKQYVILEPGAIIPAGSLFSSSISESRATNLTRVVGDQLNCNEVVVRINSVVDSTIYSVSVNGFVYSYTSDSSATNLEIQAGLEAEFDADTAKTFSYILDGDDGFIITADENTSISFSSSTTYITVEQVKVYFSVQLVDTGDISIPAGTMDTLVTSVSGFIETNNDVDYTQGRDRETDSELRLRIQSGGGGDCTGTLLTIKNAVLSNVSGVSTVSVIENTDQFPVDADGRPIGSYEVIVVGGTNEDVAQEIERTRPVGTPLFGNTSLFVVDSSGTSRFVSFSRPTKINLAIKVDYTLYPEETLPASAETAIEDAILAYVNNLPLDKDLIPSRLFGPIYAAAIAGIDSLSVEVQEITTPGDAVVPLDWSSSKFPIGASEYASVTSADIYINLV